MMIVEQKIEERDAMQLLRKRCKHVRLEKIEKVKDILENWLNKKFGYGKKPWRAVVGRKKELRPIPFHEYECDIKWTGISEEFMIEIIRNLGFIVYSSSNGRRITLAIPELIKGRKLTWAQKQIKKLNHDYSLYVEDEKRLAKFLFKEILIELSNYDSDKIEICDNYILFKDYKFGETMGIEPEPTISRECYKFIGRLSKKNKMEAYFVDGTYLGIRVFTTK